MMFGLLAALAAQAAAPVPPAPTAAPVAVQPASLKQQLDSIAAVPAGDVGIAVIDLASGRSVDVNGNRRFPMASTVKVAVAATYLAEVDAGRRRLTDMIAIDDRLRLRADGIVLFAPHPGVSLSAANLIELMITRSDNTATDVLLAQLGGPAVVEAWLRSHAIDGVRMDRTIAELLLDRRGVKPAAGQTAAEALRRWDPVAPGSVGEEDKEDDPAAGAYASDDRDSATPVGYAAFLRRLATTLLLKPASRDFLLGVMARTLTGSNRIKGLLPAGTPVAHKTGTLNGISDDVGVVTLPDGRRFVIAAFARGGSDRPTVIARAARAAYDSLVAAR